MKRSATFLAASLWVVGAVVLTATGPAQAAPQASAEASPPGAAQAGEDRADALFHEGKRLYDAGQYDASCAKLRESDVVDPAVGTLGLLAACEEKRGHLGEALRSYREVARRARAEGDARGAVAEARVRELETRIPRIVIDAPDGSKVSVDGREIVERGEQQPLRLDPGRVEIQAQRRDGTSWSRTYTLVERASVVVVISEDDRAEAAPAASAGPPLGTIVLGGVGVAGFGVMAGFGVSAMVQNGDSEDLQLQCERGDAGACNAGQDARAGAETASTVATVAFGVGVAAIAAAGVVWIFDDGGEGAVARGGGRRSGQASRFPRLRIVPGPGVAGMALERGF